MSTKTEHVTDRDNRELVLKRTFDAPPRLVFEAHSDCDHLKHWWGPRTSPFSSCEMDFREGGVWRYCLQDTENGGEYCGKAMYEEIVAPKRIVYVYTDSFTDKNGSVYDDRPTLTVTIELTEHGGKTKLVNTTKLATAEELDALLKMGIMEGQSAAWDQLEEYLETLVLSS